MRKSTLKHKKKMYILFSAILLMSSMNNNVIADKRKDIGEFGTISIETDSNILKEFRKLYIVKEVASESKKEENNNSTLFIVTSYDLSIQSCGKSRSSPQFGITTDGTNLRGQTWRTARTISSDPRVIPIGTRVALNFEDDVYKKYDGIYISRDNGSAIKGSKIDLFLGDFFSNKPSKECVDFGKTTAMVTILPN